VLKRVLSKADDMGYTVSIGPEPEFFLFKTDDDGNATTIPTTTAATSTSRPRRIASDVRKEIIFTLEEMGFEIEASHHEVAEGQHEINFKYDDALTAADNIATFRAVVRAVASQHDHATFMPKPIADINGSGSGMHSLAVRRGRQRLRRRLGRVQPERDRLPVHGRHPEPREGVHGGHQPDRELLQAAGARLRGAHLRRVVRHEPLGARPAPDAAGVSARFEVRSPDPSSCNPYLGLASMIAAGLHGIETEADPGDPVREDIYEFDDEKRQEYGIETLPPNLGAAVEELETDEVLQDALGPHTSEKFAEAKSQEFSEYLTQVSQWEEDRYLETF